MEPASVFRFIELSNFRESAKWGEFRGVFSNKRLRGISHGDIIDLKRQDYKGFDVVETYVQIVAELKERGF